MRKARQHKIKLIIFFCQYQCNKNKYQKTSIAYKTN